MENLNLKNLNNQTTGTDNVDNNNMRIIIADNIIKFRKKAKLTQAELAQKLNYSDRAISKWERGDAVPSINVLMTIAEFYDVKIQDIVYENKVVEPRKSKMRLRTILTLMSSMLVWLIATIAFVVLTYIQDVEHAWYSFIIALPVFFAVVTIFAFVWRTNLFSSIFASCFVWSTILMVSLLLNTYEIWIVYLIGLPMQIIIILASLFVHFKNKNKAN